MLGDYLAAFILPINGSLLLSYVLILGLQCFTMFGVVFYSFYLIKVGKKVDKRDQSTE